ncbi:unnamed protein product [marine sediment metagenome]|uniref:Uncharacterized protein n=1 Tax=marine sediment metagenome TaxID=412755 RepID=X1PZ09_9ZZZZ
MAKKKTPSKKEAQEVLKRAEKKIQEDKLNLILKKVGKIDTIEKTLKKTREKTDRLEALLSGKDTEGQKKQTKLSSEEELKKIEAQQEQEKVAGRQQPKQPPGQQPGQTQEQKVIGATQQFQQDIATAQAAQAQAQQKGQQPQAGLITPQGAWLLEKASHAAEIILPAFFQSKGSSGGNPLKGFFDELKIYQGIEHTVLDGFFNYMKMLPGSQRQETMRSIQSSPPTPTMTNLPPKSEMIE